MTRLFPVLLTSFSIAMVSGCKSTSGKADSKEMIESFEVKLTTATNENAGAVAQLALIVECEDCPQPERQVHPFGKMRYVPGQTRTIKVKTHRTIPWIDRNQLTFRLSTTSEDGYLPSHVWIAAVSNKGDRFTLRDADWKNQMLSSELNDPEAVKPMVAASEWVVSHEY